MNNSDKKYYFISDVHLGLYDKETEKQKEYQLVNLLNLIKENNGELFILGDLFDYWFEYRKVYQKGFFRTLTALQDLTDANIKVHYFIGNHDFMHRDFFEKEIGVELYKDVLSIQLGNKKFLIGHGDGLVENDLGYNILKKILRNRVLQSIYSLLHPDLGVYLGSITSRHSRYYTTKKDYGKPDGLLKSAKELIDKGYDYVIFGHLHIRTLCNYNNGTYINLGSWLDQPCYGLFYQDKFELVDWFYNGK